jgi:hypothetical protein
MLYSTQGNNRFARLRTAVAVITFGVISAPLAAMEEVTADSAQAAAEVRAQEARFRSDMDVFVKTVELRFKADLAFDLKQSVAPPLRLASALANNRG